MKIESLRKAFSISTAVFEMMHTISIATGYKGKKCTMHVMHIVMNDELAKDEPNMNKIDSLLSIMEHLTELNNKENENE